MMTIFLQGSIHKSMHIAAYVCQKTKSEAANTKIVIALKYVRL